MQTPGDPVVRFMAKVPDRPEDPDLCWLWRGSRVKSGYGQFWLDGRPVAAHRAAWILFIGPLSRGEVVRHRCDVRPCVRPSHLEVGSAGDNVRDRVERGRSRRGSYVPEPSATIYKREPKWLRERDLEAVLPR